MPQDEYGHWHYEYRWEDDICTHQSGDEAKQDEVNIRKKIRILVRNGDAVNEEIVQVNCPFLRLNSLSQSSCTECGNYIPPYSNFVSSCTFDHEIRKYREND